MKQKTVEDLTNDIILEFAKTIEMFDLTPLEARLFACLYLKENAMTLDEMSEAVGKSKTSMSNSIRSLLDLNLVTRVWRKGVRKDLYQANAQLFKSFKNSYITKWIDATTHQRSSIEDIKNEFDGISTDNELHFLNNQLSNILEFHKNIEDFFRNMN